MLVFALVCLTECPFKFCNHLDDKCRAGRFAFISFWMSCYCKCPVALSSRHAAIASRTAHARRPYWMTSSFASK